MKLSALAIFMIVATVMLSGCTKESPAPLVDNRNGFYGRAGSAAPALSAARATPVAGNAELQVASVTTRELAPPAASASGNGLNRPRAAATETAQQTSMPANAPFHPGSAPLQDSAAHQAWEWPVRGQIRQNFGAQERGTVNDGVVIAAPLGAAVHAAQSGEVAYAGHEVRNFGNMIIIRHANGMLSAYSNLQDFTVTKGQQVRAGQVIAHVGQSGNAKSPQLHFALRDGDHAVDPLSRLPAAQAAL